MIDLKPWKDWINAKVFDLAMMLPPVGNEVKTLLMHYREELDRSERLIERCKKADDDAVKAKADLYDLEARHTQLEKLLDECRAERLALERAARKRSAQSQLNKPRHMNGRPIFVEPLPERRPNYFAPLPSEVPRLPPPSNYELR